MFWNSLLLSACLFTAQPVDQIDKYIALTDEVRPLAIKALPRAAKQAKKDNPAMSQAIMRASADLRNGKIEPPLFPFGTDLKPGDFGTIVYGEVLQVVGDDDLIFEARFFSGHGRRANAVWIVDNKVVWHGIGLSNEHDTLWLEMPTKGYRDGKKVFGIPINFEVIGTKRYNTALGGSRTVLHLRAVDLQAVAKRRAEHKAEKRNKKVIN